MEKENPNYLNFCFDGTNFRGYLTENELIAKAYTNDWAAAITSEVFAEHKESYLLNFNKIIKILTNSRKFPEIPTNFHQNRREK